MAVQSHWFNVGSIVGWGEAGVGVVATQSFVNPSFGLRGLELLKSGLSPQQAVDSLIAQDSGRDVRQLAIGDAHGNAAAYTGKKCIEAAGHTVGKKFSAQANLMMNEKVWPAMAKAFEKSKGPLAERLLGALDAAQSVGGDIRGKQSAAMKIWKTSSSGKPWDDALVDLRVDDNPEPLKELRRLVSVQRAYEHMNAGDVLTERGETDSARREYALAEKMFPQNEEMRFWHAVMLVNNSRLDEALPMFKSLFTKNKNWRILIPRLRKVGLLNANDETFKKILIQGASPTEKRLFQ